MAAFPLNMNGKVDRKALPDPCDLIPDPDYQPAENDIEVKLAEIWKEILSLDQIGRNVSFFSTGGNSLRAMQLISAVYKAFEVNLNIRQLFKQATIASLAELIAESTRVKFETISLAAWQPEYALSPAQKSMWLDILIKKNQQAYHMQVAYIVNGYLDVDILRRVFHTIIRRHESLRTVFVSRNGEPKQVILDFDQVIAHQPFVDLTILFYTQKQVQEMIGADFNHAFDLENGPLIRVKLAKLEKQKHVLILTLHHLIADGWSLEVIRKDIFELYHKFRSGNYDLLPALPLQYKDYSEWHLERETSADYQEDKQFWSAYLAPSPALPQLPFGLSMVQSQKFIGDEIVFQLHPVVVKKLRKVAEDHQATVFMVLLTAINVLIYRHTGQPDIIVGSPVSGREEQIWNDQIGLFVNMLAIRNRIDDERTLSQTLEKVKSALLDVYAHQKYPYESVVRDLQTESDQKQAALFEIVVAMFSENNIENQPKDMVIEEIKTSNDTARYNLAFHFYERNDGISACIEFNSAIMSKKSVQCLIDHLLIIIDLMSQDNALVISEIMLGANDFGKSGKVEMTLDI
jgi:tyrocidine synthetase-3